jgi:L,D-peptidoglycan transpeptidase YkuD (ErfK/YbiS/YcfS/YnhG family)
MPLAVSGINRRRLFAVPMQLLAARLVEGAQITDSNLEYRAGRLRWSGGTAPAAVGRGGVRANKRKGDGATPTGTYPLAFGLYREDRFRPPPYRLPMRPLAQHDAWVDDPADGRYNRLVALPYPAEPNDCGATIGFTISWSL